MNGMCVVEEQWMECANAISIESLQCKNKNEYKT